MILLFDFQKEVPMNITIKDIARETGLSTATISKYLNNKQIRKENRILIEETIRRLDYRPNRTAQILRTKKTRTIGILITDLGAYFWASLINAITQYFVKYHYTVITCSCTFDPDREANAIQDLISQNPDGIIILPRDKEDNMYQMIQDAGIPIVLVDIIPSGYEERPVDCVTSDNYNGGALLARHLLANGHTNVTILDNFLNSYTMDERIRGFMDIYKERGYDVSSFLTSNSPIPCSDTQTLTEIGRQRFHQIIHSGNRPTAFFFTNYNIGVGALSAACSLPLSVLESVSLVCFDDDPLFKVMYPSLTCIAQNLKKIGERASELLLSRINNDYSDFPTIAIIDVEFRERNSVKDLTKP